MDDIEEALKDFMYANWDLSDPLAKYNVSGETGNVRFQRIPRRRDRSIHDPVLVFSHESITLIRESRRVNEYDVVATITTYIWCANVNEDDIIIFKDRKWDMIEEIKQIVRYTNLHSGHGSYIALPSNWADLEFLQALNRDKTLVDPPIVSELIRLYIKLFWSP